MLGTELFETITRGPDLPNQPRAEPLIALATRLHAAGLTPSYGPGDHGNLSCRTLQGCLITARHTSKARLREQDLVHILEVRTTAPVVTVICEGAGLPSTDTLMHWAIYERRPDVGAVVHGHDDVMLSKAAALGVPITRVSARANSCALIEEVRALSAAHDYLITRDHGFVALGLTVEAAGACVWQWFQRARSP